MHQSLFQTIPVHLLWGCSYSNNPPPCLYCNSTLSTLLKLTLCQVSITLHYQFTIYWLHKGSIPGRQSYKLRECKTLTTRPYWHALACQGAYPITVLYHIPRLGFIQSTSMGPRPFSNFNPQQPTPFPLGGAGGGVILSSMNSDKKSSLFSASKSSINPWYKGSVSSSPGKIQCSNLNFNRHSSLQ